MQYVQILNSCVKSAFYQLDDNTVPKCEQCTKRVSNKGDNSGGDSTLHLKGHQSLGANHLLLLARIKVEQEEA